MVKVFKFGTWKTSNFDSTFLTKLVFAYLGQNRITHYQSGAFPPCVSFFNFVFSYFWTAICSVLNCKVIIYSKFSCFLDKCFKLINGAIDGFYKMDISFFIRSTNRDTVGLYSLYCFSS